MAIGKIVYIRAYILIIKKRDLLRSLVLFIPHVPDNAHVTDHALCF